MSRLVRIIRISPFSGKQHTMDLPVTTEQLRRYVDGVSVQDAFPELSPEEREFILTGITPAEWDAHLPPDLADEQDVRSSAKSRQRAPVIGRVSTAAATVNAAASEHREARPPCVRKSR
jgi:hypothetical protein